MEELEAALLRADLGLPMTQQILGAVRHAFETQGRGGLDFIDIAVAEVEKSLSQGNSALVQRPGELTVVSIVGVNGTGKTTTSAKLAHLVRQRGELSVLAACDTFRAAAIEQLQIWGKRLDLPVITGGYNADPASVAHDAITAAVSRNASWLFIDTAGRLHTKNNLMLELQKIHRVMDRKLPGAPHEVLLVLDGSTGMNAINQAREFHKAVKLTGLVITKLDGTSKGGAVVAIQRELGIPVKFIGVGEQPEDLQPFNAKEFAEALFASR
jgi:fused signal recognition particle receptor